MWHAPDPKNAVGTSTLGSSEACMLGGLALKRRWQQARRAAGKPTDQPHDLAQRFLADLTDAVAYLDAPPGPLPTAGPVVGFHH